MAGRGARTLRTLPGWDPAAPRRDDAATRLRELVEGDRVAATLDGSAGCPDCAAQRRTGDPTALCPPHLRRAMGLD